MRETKRNLYMLGLGLLLSLYPLITMSRGGLNLRAVVFSLPGNSMTAAAVILLLLEVPRIRTYQRVLRPISCILLIICGGMFCAGGIADLVRRSGTQGMNTAPGLPVLVLGILLAVGAAIEFAGLYRKDQARRGEKKKRRKGGKK